MVELLVKFRNLFFDLVFWIIDELGRFDDIEFFGFFIKMRYYGY